MDLGQNAPLRDIIAAAAQEGSIEQIAAVQKAMSTDHS
jgi:hypothetical protein